MAERKPISKKLRFEVFKRDNFTCQYCGRMSPDVVLQVDHINPVKEGGDNNIMNLITSCFDCNNGKGAKKLTDRQEVQKQQEQLKLLSERKEQLGFMLKWREELQSQSDLEIDIVEAEIHKYNDQYSLSEQGRQNAKTLIGRFSLQYVLEAIAIAWPKYDVEKTNDSWRLAFSKIGGICRNRQYAESDPSFQFRQRAYYTFQKKFPVYNESRVKSAIKQVVKDEGTLKDFYEIIDESRNWTTFFENLEMYGDE